MSSRGRKGIFFKSYILEDDLVRYLEGKGYVVKTVNMVIKDFCTPELMKHISSTLKRYKVCFKSKDDFLKLRNSMKLLSEGIKKALDSSPAPNAAIIGLESISTNYIIGEESFYDFSVFEVGRSLLKKELQKILT